MFFQFIQTEFFKHEKRFIFPLINCLWWILVKLEMVWTHSVPVGTSWVQTIPRFSKITTRRMSEENIHLLVLQQTVLCKQPYTVQYFRYVPNFQITFLYLCVGLEPGAPIHTCGGNKCRFVAWKFPVDHKHFAQLNCRWVFHDQHLIDKRLYNY